MANKEISPQTLLKFIQLITKLDPVEFVGLAKILCTPVVDEKNEARPFEDVLSDMMDRFISTGRKQRKDILKVIEQAGKHKGGEQ